MPVLEELEPLTASVLAMQLKPGSAIFANGTPANNHLDMGYDEVLPHFRAPIIERARSVILADFGAPDFIAPVPTGAVGWAHNLAKTFERKPKVIELQKTAKREFRPTLQALSQTIQMYHGQGIVLDDATSDGGTSEAYAEVIEELNVEVVGIVSLFFRGREYIESRFPRAHILRCPIPYQIDWPKFTDNGKIEEL